MENYTFKINIDTQQFDQFALNHPLSNMYQRSDWTKMKPSWDSFNAVLVNNKQIVAAALVLVRHKFNLKMAYIPRGPLLDYKNKFIVETFFKNLRQYCRNIGIASVIFDPNIIMNSMNVHNKNNIDDYDDSIYMNTLSLPYIHYRGKTKSIEETTMPRYACRFIYDNVDIYNHFDKKTREKVSHYLNHGLTIYESKDCDKFYEVIQYTENRKGIALRNSEYFKLLLETYPDSTLLFAQINFDEIIDYLESIKDEYQQKIDTFKDSAPKKSKQWINQINRVNKEINETKLLSQQYENNLIVSALLLVSDGKTCELLYSGLNEAFRKYHPAYALRYKALCWGKQQGCTSFNFGGVEGDLNDGLFTFKSSFNPNVDVFIGEFVMSCNLFNVIFEKGLPALRKYRDKKISTQKKK